MSPGPAGDVALFTRAAGYALEGLAEVTGTDLDRPTPCAGWDLRTLLLHLADSADGLTALARSGELALPDPPRAGDADPAAVARDRLLVLLDVVTSAGDDGAGAAARAGAVEVAAHGWDVARACGSTRPVPPGLAADLLAVATSSLPGGVRPHLFAAPVDLPATAPAEDRLVAFLGRRPAALPVAPGVSEPGS
ncbi:maleylpyruvate isomerase family mycothiol-dependent enzyme [Geodermatophilus normandii]|uniref:Maleylpyruvate isomerase family mycothiol-dependent enzyme n=1 Tax=Geodermatophilus normandii TaxID=1137989 RepID=A0A6P0GGZ8_9ACTN|nr:maleylpyruvate isomerase family mycothiol-dependent enzyme [Geodermatophilus normandii]NEM06547.1 maleylpyruvate isomerase family mycothiol-dependent enzyme [Geodermatophilus normandii]